MGIQSYPERWLAAQCLYTFVLEHLNQLLHIKQRHILSEQKYTHIGPQLLLKQNHTCCTIKQQVFTFKNRRRLSLLQSIMFHSKILTTHLVHVILISLNRSNMRLCMKSRVVLNMSFRTKTVRSVVIKQNRKQTNLRL